MKISPKIKNKESVTETAKDAGWTKIENFNKNVDSYVFSWDSESTSFRSPEGLSHFCQMIYDGDLKSAKEAAVTE